MVAATAKPRAHRVQGVQVPLSILSSRGRLVRFTVSDVLSMIEQGILAEDSASELLDGLVIFKDRSDLGEDPLMHGPKHRAAIRFLTALAARIETPARHAQLQLPVICDENEMPEPDFAIVRGTDADYLDRLPCAADVFVVVEAAHSSLERDQVEKLAIYARAGIRQYVILNLRNRSIELYTDPDATAGAYRTRATFTPDQEVSLEAGSDGPVRFRAEELLPK